MKIILLGYMTSGKTTVSRSLATRINLPFIDLDHYIEQQECKTTTSIFEEKGEIYFRLKENEYLKELLASKDNFVLSMGGGTPCYANNMEIIKAAENTVSFYLQASIKTLVNRLKQNKEKRPLVANIHNDDLTDFVAKHLFERQYFYYKATSKINIDNKTVKEIVDEVILLLT